MPHILNAYVDGALVGSFEKSNGQIAFSYVHSLTVPISVSMPLIQRTYKNKAANAYLWGLLPDNKEVLNLMAREAGTSANSVFGLLRYHGRDVAGAVQLLPPGEEASEGVRRCLDEVSDRLSDRELEILLGDTLGRYRASLSRWLTMPL